MKIKSVTRNSPASRAGLRAGDELVSINGQRVGDPIDLRFHGSDEHLEIRASRGGRLFRLHLVKEPDQPLGLVPVEPGWRLCANKCLFCFVDQMPKGLRAPLYVKDEDYRLSFLHGNYLTLTGFSRADRDRVVAQRLSPLYISVHAADPSVRGRLLGAKGPVPIMPAISHLVSNGIKLHTQIVLCPGMNDGAVLERTISSLLSHHPGVASIAVVPVGLTRHRQGLFSLRPVDGILARQIVAKYARLQSELRKRFKRTVLYFSDEFYLLAGLDMPSSIWYDDYPQIENGVGMARLFWDDFRESGLRIPRKLKKDKKMVMATGTLAKPILEPLARKFRKINGLVLELLPVENRLFGPSVTVSGLLSSRDFLDAFSRAGRADLYALPGNVLNDDGRFIDGMTAGRFRSRLAPGRVTFGLDELVDALASWAG